MTPERRRRAGYARSLSLALAAGLCAATAGLVWLGHLATREWRRSSALVLERQSQVTLALLATALSRDMKGAQVSLLLPLEADDLAADPPHDLRQALARGFARFPYPEWFFAACPAGPGPARTWLFTRAERAPPWQREASDGTRTYPVVMTRDPPVLRDLVGRARRQIAPARRFAVFEWRKEDTRYQVVAASLHDGTKTGPPHLIGFAVNVGWVRRHYFPELLDQISRIGGSQESVSLAVLAARAASRRPPATGTAKP